METQKTPHSQSNLEKEKRSWRNQAPKLQTILQSYSNQDSVMLVKELTDQGKRIEIPEIDPHKYSQLVFDKGPKASTMEKR